MKTPHPTKAKCLVGFGVLCGAAVVWQLWPDSAPEPSPSHSEQLADAARPPAAVVRLPSAPVTRDDQRTAAAALSPLQRAAAHAVEMMDSEKRGPEDDARVEQWVAGLAAGDLPEALAFLEKCNDSRGVRVLFKRLVKRWAESDPRAAAYWAESSADSALRNSALKSVAVLWSNQNPTDAMAWVRRLPQTEGRQDALDRKSVV